MGIHFVSPWNFSVDSTEFVVLAFIVVFMIYVAFSMTAHGFTQRQNLVISIYAISFFLSCFIYFSFGISL